MIKPKHNGQALHSQGSIRERHICVQQAKAARVQKFYGRGVQPVKSGESSRADMGEEGTMEKHRGGGAWEEGPLSSTRVMGFLLLRKRIGYCRCREQASVSENSQRPWAGFGWVLEGGVAF